MKLFVSYRWTRKNPLDSGFGYIVFDTNRMPETAEDIKTICDKIKTDEKLNEVIPMAFYQMDGGEK